jgi:hypothetical protein
MRALEARLQQAYQLTAALAAAARGAEARRDAAVAENEQLWAATAHVGACVNAAVEERRAREAATARDAAQRRAEEGDDEEGDSDEDEDDDDDEEETDSDDDDARAGAAVFAAAAAALPAPPAAAAPPPPPPLRLPAGQVPLPGLTPGTAGLASLFSPDGELFAASGMFITPSERLAAVAGAQDRPRQLFQSGGAPRGGA